MEPPEEKARLRQEVLVRRESLSPEVRRLLAEKILAGVLALPEFEVAQTVLAYCSFGSEIQTGGFLNATLATGKRLILPRVDRKAGVLVLHEVSDLDSQLAPGVWGIPEPEARLAQVSIEEVDLVLAPGVAFDRNGGRLGYGGGYYDRLLGGLAVRPPVVAVAFGEQLVERVPVKPHDVKVDALLTESEVLRFGG
ncbi:MAG: 5-formyltetrahydrofolate cyclo-ligase [Rubrobacter sp.]